MNRPDVDMANKIGAIFKDDPDITISYIDAIEKRGKEPTPGRLVMKIDNMSKAAAIRHLLPEQYDLGSMKLNIDITDTSKDINANIIKAAFNGNPHFKEYRDIVNPFTQYTYHVCIFEKEVIQFENDNGGSLHGFESRIMEDLCREVLNVPLILYTTDDGIIDSE